MWKNAVDVFVFIHIRSKTFFLLCSNLICLKAPSPFQVSRCEFYLPRRHGTVVLKSNSRNTLEGKSICVKNALHIWYIVPFDAPCAILNFRQSPKTTHLRRFLNRSFELHLNVNSMFLVVSRNSIVHGARVKLEENLYKLGHFLILCHHAELQFSIIVCSFWKIMVIFLQVAEGSFLFSSLNKHYRLLWL